MLKQLAPSLWVNEVPFKLIGINFGNRMTCIQLSDDTWWLHSPTRFKQKTLNEVKSMGKSNIRYLVTPSLMHNLFVMEWKKAEPSAQLLAPAKAKNVQPDIKLNEISEDEIKQLFNNEISCIPINGIPVLQEYAFVHHASKTLILTDVAFNFGNESKGWTKIFLKLYGAYNKFGPTLTIRTLIKDRSAFSESLQKITTHHFDRIIMSHGRIIEGNGNAVFAEAFKKYL